jgi:hypothetical protein
MAQIQFTLSASSTWSNADTEAAQNHKARLSVPSKQSVLQALGLTRYWPGKGGLA